MDEQTNNLKQYPYLEVNLLKINDSLKAIADYLKRCNWNLGKISALMSGDRELIKKLDKDKPEYKPD